MPIDWFTIVAQAINFLILVWLLKRFLYQPILHAIDAREKRIATELADAAAKKAEAQKERDDFQHKNEAIDQERAALLNKAADEAKAERQRLLDDARKDADSLRAKRQEALRNEQRHLIQEVSRWTQKQVFSIARKALADLATTSLEERMVEIFVQNLRALAGAPKHQLTKALKTSTQPARVRSAFDLPQAQRSAIDSAVKETLGTETPIQYETAPELVSGIELSVNGQKVAWSIADYLSTLEKNADGLLHDEVNADAVSQPEVKENAKSEQKAEAKPAPTHEPSHAPEPVATAPKVDR